MVRDEIYPNSELIEVSCGVTFDGNLQVAGNGNIFQEKIRNDYPRLYCPEIKAGDYRGMIPYHFETEDETAGVKMSINSFAYYTKEKSYPGYENFVGEFNRLLEIFSSLI